MTDEIDPIPPQRAQEILDAAIRERLGDHWDDEETGWTKVTGHNYMARVTRGRVSLDFYVDIFLGNVTVEQTDSAPLLETGRLLLIMLIGLSIVIAFLIVKIVSGG
ncbi:MAG: hypothetical protein GC179_07515 [Anaerolineaceae bacterium]|nr:hypothetical protein [Anaerolineaceae bacterium]